MHIELKGDKLVLTIDVSGKPYQSKSALLKALEKGLDAKTVPATMVATTGGFMRCDRFKVSANVTLA
jgi:succinyl-CoA synthetase beta subunit